MGSDLLSLDRDVARAAGADPLTVDWEDLRHVSGKRALLALQEEPATPLRDALATWTTWLTVERISQPARVALEELRATKTAWVGKEALTERAVTHGLLAARSAPEASRYAEAREELARLLAGDRRRVRETRREAFHRLGVDDAGPMLLGAPSAEVARGAESFLVATEDLLRHVTHKPSGEPRWPLDLDLRLGRGAPHGWPSRLHWRSVTELLPGLDLPASPVRPPPEAHGAASFLRAVAMLGDVFRRQAVLASAPFALRHPPLFVDTWRTEMTFASALLEPVFHRKVLGLPAGRAEDQARVLVVVALLAARETAREALEEGTETSLGRFVAWVTVPARVDALREREGDDWFRNPRAFDALRDLVQVDVTASTDGASLARRFEERVG